jgi:hypothetical protein
LHGRGERHGPGPTAAPGERIGGPIDGYRESAQSWRELLLELMHRGMEIGCVPAILSWTRHFAKK